MTPEDVAERVADRINARLGVRPLLRCERRRQDAPGRAVGARHVDLPARSGQRRRRCGRHAVLVLAQVAQLEVGLVTA